MSWIIIQLKSILNTKILQNIPLGVYGSDFRGIEFLKTKLLASKFIVIGNIKYN